MEDFRSTYKVERESNKTYGGWNNQIELYQPPLQLHTGGSSWNSSISTISCNKKVRTSIWGFNDPELKRKKRVAKYKSYAVEGKMKASIRKGLRWFKHKYCALVHGY